MAYTYDEFDRLTGVTIDGNTTPSYTYEYGANGHAARITDANLGRTVETEYDLADRPCRNTIKDTSGNIVYRSTLGYDKLSNLVQMREEVNNAANGVRVTDFTYDRDNRVTRVQYDSNSTRRVDYTYDDLGRITKRTATNGSNAYASTYTYVGGGYGTNSTTPLVAGITQSGMNFTYAYDSRGNIVSETRNGSTTTYVYDGIGQLVRVNDPHENATWVYNYDRGGNITSKVKYAYTTGTLGSAVQTISYTYDSTWKDKLVGYNGATLSYDAIGNLTSDGTWTYTWEKGRQLKQMSKSGTTIQFKYDHNGIRTQKIATVNGTTTTTYYIYRGNKLVHLTQGNNWMHFYYDSQGQPAMVNFNGTIYTYIKNLQGDIVGILDSAGSVLVEYIYDVWGRVLSASGSLASTLGMLNPFKYRGYIWDTETELYYVLSRYYYPMLGRFINADCLVVGGRQNVYCYCNSSPVMQVDECGSASVTVGKSWFAPTSHSIWLQMDETARRQASNATYEFTCMAAEEDEVEAFYSHPAITLISGVSTLFECKVGFGMGLGFKFNLLGIKISALAKADITGNTGKNGPSIGVGLYGSLGPSMPLLESMGMSGLSLGFSEEVYPYYQGQSYDTPVRITNGVNVSINDNTIQQSPNVVNILAAGAYCGFGMSASLGVNMDSLSLIFESINGLLGF